MKFFSTIIRSCLGFGFYSELLGVPYRRTLQYLAQLVLLLVAILVFGSLPHVLKRVDEIAAFVDRDFPRVEIRNGLAFALDEDESARAASSRVVLDIAAKNRAQAPEDSGEDEKPAAKGGEVVIQKDRFLIQQDTFEAFGSWLLSSNEFEWPKRDEKKSATVRVMEMPFNKYGLPDGLFTGAYFRQFLRHYLWMAVPVVFLMLSCFGFLLCLAQSHMFASVGALMERPLPGRYNFAQVRNLATYAITPAAILVTVYRLFDLQGMNLPVIYLVVYGIFLVGSANACRPPKEEPAVDDSELY